MKKTRKEHTAERGVSTQGGREGMRIRQLQQAALLVTKEPRESDVDLNPIIEKRLLGGISWGLQNLSGIAHLTGLLQWIDTGF